MAEPEPEQVAPEVEMEADAERAGGDSVSTTLPDLEMPSMAPAFGSGSPSVTPMLGEGGGLIAFTEAEAAMAEAKAVREAGPPPELRLEMPAETPTVTFSSEEEVRGGAQADASDDEQLQVEVTVAASVLADGGGAEESVAAEASASSPTIDTVAVNRKLSDLKTMKNSKGHAHGAQQKQLPRAQSSDWGGGISIAQVPDELKLLESHDLNKTLTERLADETDRTTLGKATSVLTEPKQQQTASPSSDVVEIDETRQARTDEKSMEGMKLKMRRMTSFNRGSMLKAKQEGGGKGGGSSGKHEHVEKEKVGPHVAPRIAHSLLHGKVRAV